MLKVVAFMKQVAKGLQMEGNFGTAHVYRSSLNAGRQSIADREREVAKRKRHDRGMSR